MSGGRRATYDFGAFHLDLAEQRLLHDGRLVSLTPKVFDVLRLLVQNSGHLVEKERLLAEVWPDSFVEEGALSRSISILRKALGASDSDQRYIETVPKRGYRFVAPVTKRMCDDSEALIEAADRTDVPVRAMESASILDTSTARPAWSSVARWLAGAVGGLLIAGALLHAVLGRRTRETNASITPAPLHRQVTFTGKERTPTISPDGRRIAYVSYEKPEKKLIVQELAGGLPLTIFTAPEVGHLRWSPDGTDLIVWARGSGWNGVYVLPQLGGTPLRIAGGQYIACWSPDSSTIAVGSYLDGKVWFFDRFGRAQRTVSLRDVDGPILDMSWSANDVLTVVSSDYQGRYTIWTVKPDGREQRRVVVADSEIPSARWAPHGDAIYYFRRVNQTVSLFKIAVPTGSEAQDTPTTVIAGLESDHFFALSGDGRRLVYARAPFYSNLWLVEADGGNGRVQARQLTHGTSLIDRPSLSPDGTSIVFNIGHEPVTNLYAMPITGGVPKQLTFLDSFSVEAVWSADGKRIAFASTEGGKPRVWTVNAAGGLPQALSFGAMSGTFDLTWSPGSRILFQQPGNRSYYEIDPETRAERIVINGSKVGWTSSPVYSPDGRHVAVLWNRRPDRGIWAIDIAGGREALVYATSAGSVMPVGWSADGRSIYAIEGKNLNARGLTAPIGETMTEARIVRVPVNGDVTRTVLVFPFEEIGGVSMTPDGRTFVCAVYSSQSDVWIVDNFDTSTASGT